MKNSIYDGEVLTAAAHCFERQGDKKKVSKRHFVATYIKQSYLTQLCWLYPLCEALICIRTPRVKEIWVVCKHEDTCVSLWR